MKTVSIAVISHEDDLHAHAVADELTRRFRARCHVLESGKFGHRPGLAWRWPNPQAQLPSTLGASIQISDLDAVWLRRLSTHHATRELPLADDSYHEFISANVSGAVLGMLHCNFHGVLVDPPHAVQAADNKLGQLRTASEVGLRVPDTLVSQEPDQIRDFHSRLSGQVIMKPVRATRQVMSWTGRVSAQVLDNEEALRLSPNIYQELIPGSRHIRAHVFGDRVLAAVIISNDLDWRINTNVPMREHQLPDHVAQALRSFINRFGLSMGIFDLKLTDEDEYVLLELNPQGQFLFIEGICGLPLTSAMAEFLHDSASATNR